MPTDIEQSEDVDRFCPECETTFSGASSNCPECGAARPQGGWEALEGSPYPYLGKVVDGRYLLDRYLGGGASARVYRARDVKLDRPFALKILDLGGNGSSSESSLRRFENEVEALSRIRNPHVINIYESYRLEGTTPAMLTEYIEGVTLGAMIDHQGALDTVAAMRLIHQVANGLHEAHERGVIHRDIKPANIMVERLPAAGSFSRILDFGLVHLADAAGETRGFWGTPLYAAPEQCAPGSELTAATDIYSLGCVLYHALVGEPPFVRDDSRAIMRAHVEEEPSRVRDAAEQSIPEQLDAIVAEMLEKDPSDRPQEMSEVIGAMQPLTGSSGEWNRPSAEEETPDGSRDRESSEAVPSGAETSDGTRIGVAETNAASPRLAQLLKSVDLAEQGDANFGEIAVCRLDDAGDCAVLADDAGRILVMSAGGDSYFEVLEPASTVLRAVAPNTDRGRVFAARADGGLVRWRLQARSSGPEFVTGLDEEIRSMALAPGGGQIYLGVERGAILRHDLRLGSTEEICHLSSAVTGVHLAGDGNWMLASTESGGVYARRTRGGTSNLVQLDSLDGEIVSLELDPTSGVAAAVERESRLRIFHIRQSFSSITIEPAIERIRTLAVAPGRQLIALSVDGPDVRVWRIRQETLEERVPGFQDVGESAVGGARGFERRNGG